LKWSENAPFMTPATSQTSSDTRGDKALPADQFARSLDQFGAGGDLTILPHQSKDTDWLVCLSNVKSRDSLKVETAARHLFPRPAD
jgi:hypothetical protein